MNVDLKNKVIVITGASRGIGSYIAYYIAKEGASVVINYNESYDHAKRLLRKINKFNKNCMICKADVTKKDNVSNLCKKVIGRYEKIDVLINNAGISSDNLCFFLNEEQWDNVMDVNAKSVFLCSKIFGKEMIKQNYGKILNIASYKGQNGCKGQTNYSAAKAAVIGFTMAYAKEIGEFNIAVNAVCPSFIETDLNKNNYDKKKVAMKRSVLPLKYGLDDLVNFIILFCSDKIRGVSGRTFNLDSRIE